MEGNDDEDEDEDEEGVLERYRRRCCRGCHGRRFSAALTTRHHLLRHSNILLGTELLLLAGASRSCELVKSIFPFGKNGGIFFRTDTASHWLEGDFR